MISRVYFFYFFPVGAEAEGWPACILFFVPSLLIVRLDTVIGCLRTLRNIPFLKLLILDLLVCSDMFQRITENMNGF